MLFLTVPREAGVVDDDVDLAIAELRRLLDQAVDVVVVEDIARHRGSLAAGLVNAVGDLLGLVCTVRMSASRSGQQLLKHRHTFIDV